MSYPSFEDRNELAAAWKGEALTGIDPADTETFDAALLSCMRQRSKPVFFFDQNGVSELAARIAADLPDQTAWIVDRANSVLAHKFPAADEEFDPYIVQLGKEIDWYQNPTVEPQFIFTLNRHRFWPELAMSFRFTGDRRYIDELQAQILSWCEQSPPLENLDDWQKFPQCWWLLDAAIRADTWVWALQLVLSAPEWDAAINTLVVHRLLVHAKLLRHLTPLSDNYWAPNWLIMQAQGLLNVALMFPEFGESEAWGQHALDVLQLCLSSQFFDDGGHCELSPIYHECCLRWLAEPLHLARLNGKSVPATAWDMLRKACEFHYQIMNPDGTLPALSDSDRLSMGILTQMALVFDRPAWMRFRPPSARDCFFLSAVPEPHPIDSSPRQDAVAFSESGYYVLRSGDSPKDIQLVFDCATHGGGHGHFDLLGFDLYGYGRPLLADSGRLIYDDSPDRHWVVGTSSHNTICLDGQNHAALGRDMTDRIHMSSFVDDVEYALLSGWHEAYAHLDGKPRVGRAIWYDRRSTFVIADWISSTVEHDIEIGFTAPETKMPHSPEDGMTSSAVSGNVDVRPLLRPGQRAAARETFYSPNYGFREPAVRLVVSQRASSAVFVTVLRTYDSASDRPPFDADARVEVDGIVTLRSVGHGRADVTLTPPFEYSGKTQ